jgi:hypothetical protein
MGQCSNYLHEGKWKKQAQRELLLSGSPFDGQSTDWLVCFAPVVIGPIKIVKHD